MQIQRGIRLFNQVLFEESEIATLPKPEHNGRDPQLIAARDNFLLHRFYYKSKVQRKIYNDTLVELSQETWLSKLQIQKIIQSKAEDVLLIKKNAPSVKQLKEQWSHIQW